MPPSSLITTMTTTTATTPRSDPPGPAGPRPPRWWQRTHLTGGPVGTPVTDEIEDEDMDEAPLTDADGDDAALDQAPREHPSGDAPSTSPPGDTSETADEDPEPVAIPLADGEEAWDALVASAPHPPLPDDEYSILELGTLALLAGLAVVLPLGALLWPSFFVDNFLGRYIWDPIVDDAQGDIGGYNVVNTAAFTVVLLAFVIVIAAFMRRAKLPTSSAMLLAFVPWVVWAALVRVLEDAALFKESVRFLFISPLIHFHIAGWVLLSWALAHFASRMGWMRPVMEDAPELGATAVRRRPWLELLVAAILAIQWSVLYRPAVEAHHLGMTGPVIGAVLAAAVLAGSAWWFDSRAESSVVGMSVLGGGSAALALGHWMQFFWTPWPPSEDPTLWPALLVLGIPAAVCTVLWCVGREAAAELAAMDREAGVLPRGASPRDWMEWTPKGGVRSTLIAGFLSQPTAETHDPPHFHRHALHAQFERLTPRALLAHPLLLVAVFGQLADGVATWMGVDFFGYQEKHVLGRNIMDWGSFLWEGAWAFLLAKIAIVGLLAWVFMGVRFERRQLHLRMLIVLALLVVGLAPGLRDVGRLMLDV